MSLTLNSALEDLHPSGIRRFSALAAATPGCVSLTLGEPGEDTRFIHDRMPLMLPEERVGAWIDPEAKPEELLTDAVTAMRCLRGVETT